MSEEQGRAALAMVATSSARLPDASRIREVAGLSSPRRGFVGKLFGRKAADEEAVAWAGTNLVIPFRDAMIAVSLMPAPIPWSELEGPCATSWWWPEAEAKMRRHTHHFLVVVMGGEIEAVERRLVLTRAVSAVAALSDAVGVYWGEGSLVQEPRQFVRIAKTASPQDIPIPLWIDIRVEKNDDDARNCFTTGMIPLGFSEIEVLKSDLPNDNLYNFVGCMASYIIENRLQVPEGQTMGRSAEERYWVTYGPSMFERAVVMNLTKE